MDTIPSSGGFDVSVGNVTQTFTRLDFLNHTFDLTNGVLTIGPLSMYMTLPMTYNGVQTKEIIMDITGELRWGGLSGEVILTSTNLNTRIPDDILNISKVIGLSAATSPALHLGQKL